MSNPLANLGWPALSEQDAARIIKLVRPKPEQHDDCLREAAISLEWIKRKTATLQSSGERKAALREVARHIAAAIESIETLPITTQRELHLETFQHSLDRTLALARKIAVTRSGGGLGHRIDAAKKRAAADCAIDIIREYGTRGPPTLYRYSPHFELAALLFELATGKRSNVERAFVHIYKERVLQKKVSARSFEEWEMLFEDSEPKVFEE
jgi:hypothetical protein